MDEDPSPFFEPLLRSFLLGLGAGAIFESLHVCTKVRRRAAAAPPPPAPLLCHYFVAFSAVLLPSRCTGLRCPAQDSWSAFF